MLGAILLKTLAEDLRLCGKYYRHWYVDCLAEMDSLMDDEGLSMNL